MRRPGRAQEQGGVQAMLARIPGMAPGLLGGAGRSGGRSRSGGAFGFLRGLTGGGGSRGGLPVNAKALTGLLGAGAAGTALVRRRRAGRRAAGTEGSEPT